MILQREPEPTTRDAVVLAPGARRLVVDFDSEFVRVWHRTGGRQVAAHLVERIATLAASWSAKQVCIAVTAAQQLRPAAVPGYRSPLLDALAEHLPDCTPVATATMAALEARGWPVLGAAGFEAADVCATLAYQAVADRQPLVVLSSDRRCPQVLHAGRVTLARSATWRRGTLQTAWLSAQQLKQSTGLDPTQWADRLTLIGLHLPGCGGPVGIGAANATKLVAAAGSLAELLATPWKWCTSKSQSAALVAWQPAAATIAQLVTLRTDAPVIWTVRDQGAELC